MGKVKIFAVLSAGVAGVADAAKCVDDSSQSMAGTGCGSFTEDELCNAMGYTKANGSPGDFKADSTNVQCCKEDGFSWVEDDFAGEAEDLPLPVKCSTSLCCAPRTETEDDKVNATASKTYHTYKGYNSVDMRKRNGVELAGVSEVTDPSTQAMLAMGALSPELVKNTSLSQYATVTEVAFATNQYLPDVSAAMNEIVKANRDMFPRYKMPKSYEERKPLCEKSAKTLNDVYTIALRYGLFPPLNSFLSTYTDRNGNGVVPADGFANWDPPQFEDKVLEFGGVPQWDYDATTKKLTKDVYNSMSPYRWKKDCPPDMNMWDAGCSAPDTEDMYQDEPNYLTKYFFPDSTYPIVLVNRQEGITQEPRFAGKAQDGNPWYGFDTVRDSNTKSGADECGSGMLEEGRRTVRSDSRDKVFKDKVNPEYTWQMFEYQAFCCLDSCNYMLEPEGGFCQGAFAELAYDLSEGTYDSKWDQMIADFEARSKRRALTPSLYVGFAMLLIVVSFSSGALIGALRQRQSTVGDAQLRLIVSPGE